jgi:mxaA protein
MRWVLLFLALQFVAATADAQVRSVATSDPRPMGYLVGDVIERTVEVKVDKPFKLAPGSVPQPGQLAYWLNLVSVDEQQHDSGDVSAFRIKFRYQTFYAPLDTRKQTIPGMKLRFTDGARVAVADVPAWKFTTSPLREVSITGEGQSLADQIQPDIRPRPHNTRPTERGLIAGLVLALLTALALARYYAVWPFRRRPDRPFTRAASQIRRLHPDKSSQGYEAAILVLHRAFDSAAGKRLLSDDLAPFLAQHAELASVGGRVARFFEASAQWFYRGDKAGAAAELPAEELSALARDLGAAERRAA